MVGYSLPVDQMLTFEELQSHLYSSEEQLDAIPYVTSYYKPRWGFVCRTVLRQSLKPGSHRAVIDASLQQGSLTYGDFILKGQTSDEILLSSYVCHPSMANNEVSGPVVLAALARWLLVAAGTSLYLPVRVGSRNARRDRLPVSRSRCDEGEYPRRIRRDLCRRRSGLFLPAVALRRYAGRSRRASRDGRRAAGVPAVQLSGSRQ